jgi:tetratricopeptide (TPR) repeat protein
MADTNLDARSTPTGSAAASAAAGAFRARYQAIDARLDAGLPAAERDAGKGEIVGLFKAVETQIAELTALKDEIRKLVDKWKTSAPTQAPQFTAEKPVVHADHLGASTFIEKGWSRLSLGDYEGAEQSLRKALELSPNDPQAEALLGWAQMLQEKYDEALLNFQKVLMRQPTNALARINVGYICLKKRIFGEAIEHLSKAIRLDNDRKAVLYAHFYLGLVYLEREMFEDAETFFRKTLALGPNLIEAYYELGRALWFDLRRDEAMQVWRDGDAANKFNPWGKRCAEMLRIVEEGGEPPAVA